jgi:hypothetical protein
MNFLLWVTLVSLVVFTTAIRPDEDSQEDIPGWIPKTDSDGNIQWLAPGLVKNDDFIQIMASTNCTNNFDCNAVSQQPGYAECVAGICRCKLEFGFTGSATIGDKCRCNYPKIVYLSSGTPVCRFINRRNLAGCSSGSSRFAASSSSH